MGTSGVVFVQYGTGLIRVCWVNHDAYLRGLGVTIQRHISKHLARWKRCKTKPLFERIILKLQKVLGEDQVHEEEEFKDMPDMIREYAEDPFCEYMYGVRDHDNNIAFCIPYKKPDVMPDWFQPMHFRILIEHSKTDMYGLFEDDWETKSPSERLRLLVDIRRTKIQNTSKNKKKKRAKNRAHPYIQSAPVALAADASIVPAASIAAFATSVSTAAPTAPILLD